MNTTNTDNFSLLASLVGFALAIYAIVTQPVQVDSKRPSQTRTEPKAKASDLAFERLWDDPFAIYSGNRWCVDAEASAAGGRGHIVFGCPDEDAAIRRGSGKSDSNALTPSSAP